MWKGNIEIPNLSEENDADEVDVSFESNLKLKLDHCDWSD